MDKDTFETKLREAKRQKSQVEQELESVSERWRTERRRLNSEIDRLEAALTEAKEVRRKTTGSKTPAGIDPVDAAKMQSAADDRIKNAEKEFEGEREKLRSEISRLQRAVAEMIERSNNPMRSTEPIKEQFQTQLDEAFKAKQQVEEEFYRARLSWEEEKLKTAGEIFKLRRSAGPAKAKGKLDDEERVKELERRIEETSRSQDASAKQFAEEKRRLDTLLKEAELQIEEGKESRSRLENQLKEAHAQLQAMTHEKTQLSEDLRKASSMLDEERNRVAASARSQDAGAKQSVEEKRRMDTLLREAGYQIEEGKESRARLESQLKEVHARLQAEMSKHESEIQQLQKRLAETKDTVSADVVDQLRKQYDDKLQGMIHEKTQLSEDLRNASSMLDEERTRFAAAASAPPQLPTAARNAVDADKLNAELARVEQMIGEIAHLIDDPNTELSMVIRKNVERAELDAYLKGILFSMGRNRGL